MAEKKMTRKEALNTLIEVAAEWKSQNFADDDLACAHIEKAIEVANKMLASIEKQANRPKTPSKASIENDKLADNLVGEMVAYGEPVDTKWITEHVQYVLTSQKATAVAKVAIAKGDIVRTVDEKKHVWYSLAEWYWSENILAKGRSCGYLPFLF